MNMYTYMIYRSVYETQRDGERKRDLLRGTGLCDRGGSLGKSSTGLEGEPARPSRPLSDLKLKALFIGRISSPSGKLQLCV